ncbi:restriction endonuclease subunit S [Proteus mirabilis]|uniref:restriction endonuclease subunit S n=1 Tax=Proteus mirabilis TaxID=584 RepID=UPI001FAE3E14|nr:restriction endonuclease subunit S [Proteus mirabilis]MCI9729181.1 restriction endonuclease subunit S [Proteus mirabilis]MCI9732936.1 restriction endonuclease subunit S [Proteus mirabilis]MCI9736692.1 restriction endonuclease subunit S [Proteus mirabilis]MCI9757483.1 restriction endonuclease subunit S [Proteus mirabilis]MCI9761241.1 restriction endonuclease subunit S [Proteus mirabilis]
MSVEVTETGLNLIPAGYKQTEVGVIPEDWEIFSLGQSIAKTQLGGNYKNSEHDTGQPLIKMGNLDRGFVKLSKQEFIIGNASESDLLNYGDVLFNTRNTLELVGKVAIWKNELPKAYFNSNLMRISFKEDLVSSNLFMNALMNSERFIKALSDIAIGTTSVAAIYNRDLFLIKVALPTKKEQTAIANALSDVDALISKLENLIAKKQAIKTATMQQLLTGRTRLPQFALREDGTPKGTKPSELGEIPEDWEILPAREAVEFFGGYGFSSRLSSDSGVKWLKIANVGLNEVKWDANSYLPENLLTNFRSYSLKANDVVMALTRPLLGDKLKIAKITSSDLPALLNQRVAKLIPNRSNCLEYIFYVVQRAEFIAQMNLAMAGTDPPNIGTTTLGNINIVLPPAEQEQTAIATILSDMDAEIQALEQRLGKTRQIKQGMMQELLTGKTRLIKGEAHG